MMPTLPKQVETASVEGQILEVVRELLLELGSVRAAQEAETPADWARTIFDGTRPASRGERYRIVQPSRDAPEAPTFAKSWTEVLRHHAQIEPDRVQIHLLEEDSGRDITYGQLLETASRVAAGLLEAGLRRND